MSGKPHSDLTPPDSTGRYPLPTEAVTIAFARCLARDVRPGDVIALEGDLGAGKTLFARALINALPGSDGKPAEEEVPSPTFTLVQLYERQPAPVWHFDLYRIERPEDAWELGLEEAFAEGVSLIEWPERLGRLLPAGALTVRLEQGETGRHVRFQGGPAWRERLDALGLVAAQ